MRVSILVTRGHGGTSYDYLLDPRIERVCLLLKATMMTVGEDAVDVGLKGQGHLGQPLKHATGMVPPR